MVTGANVARENAVFSTAPTSGW